ncbi:hypothetical protein [Pseudomonas syringae]|uniref:hypothetical protein n=1 Tax=Pseudomonas syringae TaxID=317 RepID=UPI000BB5FCA7|nr:hypothetical protein [Pseudomonas syringae]MCK9744978.1 hypothetical protein [Pseudomonas syringae pv. syringae]MCK9747921.1 hypothetical protein [Pseudomonas syringae pv. syringae]MCK9767269.1 hypothetical protein [Pseudomonas syringae pv. syringae]PBP30755.1 hypothetical protein CCL12_24145 [Pseudomonas syringae]
MPRIQQNLNSLRDALSNILGNEKNDFTDTRIPELLNDLGLEDCTEHSSKRERLRKAADADSDTQRLIATGRAVQILKLPVHELDQLQELVRDDGSTPRGPGRFYKEMMVRLTLLVQTWV